MGAFAANSLLTREALGAGAIDAASFMSIRLLSGAIALGLLTAASPRKLARESRGRWPAAVALFLYAGLFPLHTYSLRLAREP